MCSLFLPLSPCSAYPHAAWAFGVCRWYTNVILSYQNARELTDLYAIAPYFGTTLVTDQQAAEVKRLGLNGLFSWLNGGPSNPNGPLDFGSLGDINATIAGQLAVLNPLGIPLTSYEGGQHLVAAGGLAWDDALNALLDAANRDARMKATYLQVCMGLGARIGMGSGHRITGGMTGCAWLQLSLVA